MTRAVPPALLADRIRRAGDVAAEQDVELLLVTPGTDLRYLLDADGASHERLTCLVLPAAGHRAPPALVVARLEAPGWADAPLAELGVEVVTWDDGEDGNGLARVASLRTWSRSLPPPRRSSRSTGCTPPGPWPTSSAST